MSEYLGCGDSGCKIERPTGQHTNGGCRCLHIVPVARRVKIVRAIQRDRKRIRALTDAINRSGLDISACGDCGEVVVCVPDGMPLCEECAAKMIAEQ